MRKNVICITMLLAALTGGHIAEAADTAPQAADKAVLAEKSLLTDLFVVNNSKLVAVGERGHILTSPDAIHWSQAGVPVQANLNAVYFASKQTGWAVGHDATILKTQDGGVNWQIQQYAPESDKPLFDVYFFDENNGIAVGAYGLFYRTSDSGTSWQQEFHQELLSDDDQDYLQELQETDPDMYQIETAAILPHFNRIYVDGNVLYLAGEAGFLAKSTDGGGNWQRVEEFYNGSLFDVTRTPQMSLLAVGLRGHAFASDDQGNSWYQLAVNETATFNSAFSDADDTLFLVGNAGTLLLSRDNGQTFSNHSLADGKVIVNGVVWQNQLVLVTEVGIKTINLSELK